MPLINIVHSGNQDYPITLKQTSNKLFTLSYGKDVKKGMTYSEACKELGIAILHSLSCCSQIDNS